MEKADMHDDHNLDKDSYTSLNLGSKNISNTEVNAKKRRRLFTTEYKLRILEELDRCPSGEARGAIIRREGLFSSAVSDWKQARTQGCLSAFSKRVGRPSMPNTQDKQKIESLEKEAMYLRKRLAQAEAISLQEPD